MFNKKILMFPGQGSQYVGMCNFKGVSGAERIYECGSDILGYDLKTLINEGDETKLNNTEFAQPAIFAASLIALAAAKESGFLAEEYNAAAGHSLGEYAALVCCGVLDIENGFKVIKTRSRIMAKAGEKNPGAMAAVLGLNEEDIVQTLSEIEGVTPANYNAPGQIVIAGTFDALDKAESALKSKGAKRVVRLKTSAAFHTELMREASIQFLREIQGVDFSPAKADFYSNVFADKLSDFSNIPGYLAKHIRSSVKFAQELEKIREDGYDTFIEIGPGKVLSGLAKKTLSNISIFNVEDSASLEKTVMGIKEIEGKLE
ncbi:MAG: ACP S-malonyltransferase [Oscillospiraceae bacterium]|nr:ACP S-malonyltransferase [Oscillospiraceae bacterium]